MSQNFNAPENNSTKFDISYIYVAISDIFCYQKGRESRTAVNIAQLIHIKMKFFSCIHKIQSDPMLVWLIEEGKIF